MTDSPFRNAYGQRYLRTLFYETTLADKTGVVYTLKDRDHEGYPSLYRLYMESDDPTEYSFAISNLDGWDHWETLCECTWFKPYITRWRRELEIRAKARALLAIKALAADPTSKEHYQASKFLINSGWREKATGRGAGRPSKDEVQKVARQLAEDSRNLEEDFQRVTGVPN